MVKKKRAGIIGGMLGLVTAAVIVILLYPRANKNSLEFSGVIEAIDVDISSKVLGRIVMLKADEGTVVQANDTVAIIDPTTYELGVRQAAANLNLSEARLAQDESRLSLAKLSLDRIRQLRAESLIAQDNLEKAETDYEVLKRDAVALSEVINQTRAAQELARQQLKECYITAPVGGHVTTLVHRTGETAYPGTVLLTVTDLAKVWLVIYVREKDLGRLKLGQPVSVKIDAFPNKSFPGRISFIAQEAEFTPKYIQTKDERINDVYRVKVEIENNDLRFKPGMPADAVIKIDS
jgi:HlyD family secretion protein